MTKGEIYVKYLEKLNDITKFNMPITPDIMGCGSFGCAFDVGNDIVLKITSDLSEAQAAAKLVTLGGYINVYKVHKVYKLGKTKTYAIFQERLNDPRKIIEDVSNLIGAIFTNEFSEKYMADIYKKLFYNYGGISHFRTLMINIVEEYPWNTIVDSPETTARLPEFSFVVTDGKFDDIIRFLINMHILDYGEIHKSKKTLKDHLDYIINSIRSFDGNEYFEVFDQIASGVAWLYKNGIKFYDIHSGNVMENNAGDVVIIDLGVSKTEGGGKIDLIESYIRNIIGK